MYTNTITATADCAALIANVPSVQRTPAKTANSAELQEQSDEASNDANVIQIQQTGLYFHSGTARFIHLKNCFYLVVSGFLNSAGHS